MFILGDMTLIVGVGIAVLGGGRVRYSSVGCSGLSM